MSLIQVTQASSYSAFFSSYCGCTGTGRDVLVIDHLVTNWNAKTMLFLHCGSARMLQLQRAFCQCHQPLAPYHFRLVQGKVQANHNQRNLRALLNFFRSRIPSPPKSIGFETISQLTLHVPPVSSWSPAQRKHLLALSSSLKISLKPSEQSEGRLGVHWEQTLLILSFLQGWANGPAIHLALTLLYNRLHMCYLQASQRQWQTEVR